MGEAGLGSADTSAIASPVAGDTTATAASAFPASREVATAQTAAAAGGTIGRYQIRRLLGAGGMGQVYLARDLVLGRSVALKVIRRDRVGGIGTARFVEEARTTAALNHPHVVQLYDVGDHGGEPYLALEYVDGETLHDRLLRGGLSVDESLRVVRAVADALVHAHRAGIHHCDLKPGNVMMGRDGRLRVVDFGLAHRQAAPTGPRAGTPDWMAPEQWTGGPLTDRVDVWALGALTHRLLTGHHPFGDQSTDRRRDVLEVAPASLVRDDVPLVVSDLVARSLALAPAGRPAASEWFDVVDRVLEGRGLFAGADGPFRGLAAFEERHTRYYFGRELDVDAFLERLRDESHLPIVGPSGVGKSSFLHAGVVPRLRAREPWTVVAFRPGPDPVCALARAVLTASLGDDGTAGGREVMMRELAAALRQTPTLLAARLSTIANLHKSSVLLAVDQLEELFTHGAPDDEVQAFLALLAAATDDPRDPTRVVFTMRDDFLGRVASVRALFVLRRLEADDLRRTITGPLDRCGYRLDDDTLADTMLDEVGPHTPAGLPMLQFACRALWEARDADQRLLRRAAYQRMGGVAGALAQHADGVLAQLTADEQRVARQLLLGLVVGTTRRAIPRSRLLAGQPAQAPFVLDRLVAARLLVQRMPSTDAEQVVEIAHESLLHTWHQLASWLDESRDERRLLVELEEAASFWDRRGRRAEETWSVAELTTARHRLAHFGVAAPTSVEGFLAAGEARHRADRRRARRRAGLVGAAAMLVTALSLALAGEYRNQKLEAERQADALRLAGGNLGRVELALAPFDWQGDLAVPVDAAALPALTWRMYGVAAGDPHRPGPPLPEVQVRRRSSTPVGLMRIDLAEAPGGTVFLRIDGRGRAGQSCPPSWLRVQQLPGFAERAAAPPRLEIRVPTCQASAVDSVAIEAGPFIYGGPGAPATRFADYLEPERVVHLPAFAIDRVEVSNGRFEPFADMTRVTGYPVPSYPGYGVLGRAHEPSMPVTAIDAYTAEAFCRFMGKRLPGDLEWAKAARGGLVLRGAPNPSPRRLYPWGEVWDSRCANIDGTADGHRWMSPVGGLPCGASPYGVLDLAGNAAEWISREGQSDGGAALRVVRGGAVNSPPGLEHSTTVFRNAREGRYFDFSIGMRCATTGADAEDFTWPRP
jgi:formylglycine-generating enzyme required for sulfatase activity